MRKNVQQKAWLKRGRVWCPTFNCVSDGTYDITGLEDQTAPDKVDVTVEGALGNSLGLDDSGKDITPSTISTSAGVEVPPTQVDETSETSSESAIVADISPSDLKQQSSCSEANLVSGTENNLMSSPLLKCHKKQMSF